jgi:sphingomyelin phosphodiesterase 2
MTHRIIQAFDTAQFLENTRGDCTLQILAGDLNTEPEDLAYRILLSHAGMKDSFMEMPTIAFATHENPNNTYTPAQISGKDGIRIDYIFYRNSRDFECNVLNYELPLIDKIPQLNISYSDHEAVHAQISIKRKLKESISIESDRSLVSTNIKNLKECIIMCNNSLKELESHRRSYTMLAIGLIVILINVVEMNVGYGFKTIYLVIKFLLCGLTIFFIFMASLWNMMEKHGILSGKLSMQIALHNNELALVD